MFLTFYKTIHLPKLALYLSRFIFHLIIIILLYAQIHIDLLSHLFTHTYTRIHQHTQIYAYTHTQTQKLTHTHIHTNYFFWESYRLKLAEAFVVLYHMLHFIPEKSVTGFTTLSFASNIHVNVNAVGFHKKFIKI